MVFESFKLSAYDAPLQPVFLPLVLMLGASSRSDLKISLVTTATGVDTDIDNYRQLCRQRLPIPRKQIYQLRKNRGVNFGGVFVLEQDLCPEFFPTNVTGDNNDNSQAVTEYKAISALIGQLGLKTVRSKLEAHWKNYLNDADWQWLKDNNINSVRIPLGYWIFKNAAFCPGTPFENISAVYKNAWDIFKQYYVVKAQKYGISIMVDYHVYPGLEIYVGDHFRTVKNKYFNFLKNKTHQLVVLLSLKFAAESLKNYENIAGIQISNNFDDNKNLDEIKIFYARAINAIRKKNPDISILISDGYSAPQWAQWITELEEKLGRQSSNNNSISLNVSLESHFFSFGSNEKAATPAKVTAGLNNKILPNLQEFDVDVVIGEYNCQLPIETWRNGESGNANRKYDNNNTIYIDNNDNKKKLAQVEYGTTQASVFSSKARHGTYFWTYKLPNLAAAASESLPRPTSVTYEPNQDGQNFREMLNVGSIPRAPPAHLLIEPSHTHYAHSLASSLARFKEKKDSGALTGFMSYLTCDDNHVLPTGSNRNSEKQGSGAEFNEKSESEQNFQLGFQTAWFDALSFFEFGKSQIGKVYTLKNWRQYEFTKKRGEEQIETKHWEEGYIDGINVFEKVAFGV